MKFKLIAVVAGALILSSSIFAGLEVLENNKPKPVPTPEIIYKTEEIEEIELLPATPSAKVIAPSPNSVIFKPRDVKFESDDD